MIIVSLHTNSYSKTMKVESVPVINPDKMVDAIQMLSNQELAPLFQKIESEYLYWDKVKYMAPKAMDKLVLWQAVKIQRRLKAQDIQFGNCVFHFTITQNMLALLHDFDMNLGGSLGTKSIIPATDKSYYLISSIMEEAIASSQMEGASTTRRIAKDMLRKKLKPINKSQQMIANNYETINQISKDSDKDFSVESLLSIHRSIANKTLDNVEDEGVFRKNDDILVGYSVGCLHTLLLCEGLEKYKKVDKCVLIDGTLNFVNDNPLSDDEISSAIKDIKEDYVPEINDVEKLLEVFISNLRWNLHQPKVNSHIIYLSTNNEFKDELNEIASDSEFINIDSTHEDIIDKDAYKIFKYLI